MKHIKLLFLTLIGIGIIALTTTLPSIAEQQLQTEQTPSTAPDGQEIATFAGGCFWCLESELKDLKGVIKTRVGYTGGHTPHPSYNQVSSAKSGHAEAVEIYYDPALTDYKTLATYFLTKAHDPTQLNKQWVDVGPQYRSAIYYHDDTQKQIAEDLIARLTTEKHFKNPIVTEISPAVTFWEAEEYHQNYYEKYEQQNGFEHRRVTIKKKIKAQKKKLPF